MLHCRFSKFIFCLESIETAEVVDEVLINLLNVNCEICGQLRGKKGYKIHLAACRKKSLKVGEQADENTE